MTTKDVSMSFFYTKSEIDLKTGSVFDTPSESVMTWTDVQTGIENPLHVDQIRKHQNATTAYSASKRKVKVYPGSVTFEENDVLGQPSYQTVWTGQLLTVLTWPSPGSPSDDDLTARAYESFVKKANRELRSMQSLVSAGELGETLRLIRSPAKALLESLTSYLERLPRKVRQRRRGNRGSDQRAKSITGVIRSSYLEGLFGWVPLVNDVEAGAKALAETFAAIGTCYKRINASASKETSRTLGPAYIAGLGSGCNWLQTDVEKSKTSYRIVGEVSWEADGSFPALAQNMGLTLHDFVPSLWELIPLSFVVDMFFNIGDILEAACFNRAAVRWMSGTFKGDYSVDHSAMYLAPPIQSGVPFGTSAAGGAIGSAVTMITEVNRSLVPPYQPSLAFRIPGMSRALSLSALLGQYRSSSQQIRAVYTA